MGREYHKHVKQLVDSLKLSCWSQSDGIAEAEVEIKSSVEPTNDLVAS